jgi:hypothetical protein
LRQRSNGLKICLPAVQQLWPENPRGFRVGGIWFLFHGIWFLSCVITCSDFYPLSNQINLFMVINIWGIIIKVRFATHTGFMMTPSRNISILQKRYHIRVITKLPNSVQSYKGKVKTHKYINRQNLSTTGCHYSSIYYNTGTK